MTRLCLMFNFKRVILALTYLFSSLFLVACGGGGGDAPPVVNAPDASEQEKPILPTEPPEAPAIYLEYLPIKQMQITWQNIKDAKYYKLWEKNDIDKTWHQVEDNIAADQKSLKKTIALFSEFTKEYYLQACNEAGCRDSNIVTADENINQAIGFFKASNPDVWDYFGWSVAISDDGSTIAISAFSEDSLSAGINGNDADNSGSTVGAVYVFAKNDKHQWAQQAYIKKNNPVSGESLGDSIGLSSDGNVLAVSVAGESYEMPYAGAVYIFTRNPNGAWSQQYRIIPTQQGAKDYFGFPLAISGDGNTLVVGSSNEDSAGKRINRAASDNSQSSAGAAYIFRFQNNNWIQQAYLKASNAEQNDKFGSSVAISSNGNIVAIGAIGEKSGVAGVNGNPSDNSVPGAGAVYVFEFNQVESWKQTAYLKSSFPSENDFFGYSLALSQSGGLLAVGAIGESMGKVGSSDAVNRSGAVFVYRRSGSDHWAQVDFLKANNPSENDEFGYSVAMAKEGDLIAVGAIGEDSDGVGIAPEQNDNAQTIGAVYLYQQMSSNVWQQIRYIKPSNATHNEKEFGSSIAISEDGTTLAVGSPGDASDAAGINGDQSNANAAYSGAAFIY